MAPSYVSKPGDCALSIASRYGISPSTLVSHPDNASLREGDPATLAPGQSLTVPEADPASYACGTGARHRFVAQAVPAVLRLQLEVDEPYAYTLVSQGRQAQGQTDGSSPIELSIASLAASAELRLWPARLGEDRDTSQDLLWPLQLGALEPYNTARGAQARLQNLGLFLGAVNGEWGPESVSAANAFQTQQGLAQSDALDDAWLTKLRVAHDGA